MLVASVGMVYAGLRSNYRTSYTSIRLRALAITTLILGLLEATVGVYSTLTEGRNPDDVGYLVIGINFAIGSVMFFVAWRRKQTSTDPSLLH
jgi:heme A synthase